MLFAGGGVLWEQWLARPRLGWVKLAYGALMVLAGALLAPTLIPLLPAETYIRYAAATRLQQPQDSKRAKLALPPTRLRGHVPRWCRTGSLARDPKRYAVSEDLSLQMASGTGLSLALRRLSALRDSHPP